jgi:undecaprenyl-diphosphatase
LPDFLILQAALLGVIEGLTEFLPVSSTGHLILAGYLMDFRAPPGKVFEVVIQAGAIVAVCLLYARRLLGIAAAVPTRPEARLFVVSILVAFLPAALLGVLFHPFIKTVLFSPWVVAVSLVLGGIVILVVERLRITPRHAAADRLPPGLALRIGLCQAVAMIPGVSRSGATILGAVVMGVERRAAAEFSFFLAIPTMLGATAYDLYKNRAFLNADDLALIAVGFVCAMIAAMIVVKALLAYLARHTFEIFGWYRIALGLAMLVVLAAFGAERPPGFG